MESLPSSLIDPITKHPYDLAIHIPHILPCCGETCAITTIHDSKSTDNKCPFCAETLPDAGWPINKVLLRMLSAAPQPQLQPSKQGSQLRRTCLNHPDKDASMICLDDNVLLCLKCMSETSRHVGHQVEDLQPYLELLKTNLKRVKPKVTILCEKYERILARLCKENTTLMYTTLQDQILQSENVLQQVTLFEASNSSVCEVRLRSAQVLCRIMEDIDVEEEAKRLEKELRGVIGRWVEERLKRVEVEEQPKFVKAEERKEISGKCVKTLQRDSGPVSCLQVLAPGQLASGSTDKTIRIWDTNTATSLRILQGHTGYVGCLQVLAPGQLASGSQDTTIRIWDISTTTCLKILQGHTSAVLCLQVLAPDQLASGSADNTIRIWDTSTGTCLKIFQGHSNTVKCLQVLAPGQLVSGSEDKTIRIWNTSTATCIKILLGHTDEVFCLQVLAPGKLASGSRDKTIKIWE